MTSENVTDPKSVEPAEVVSAKAVDDQSVPEAASKLWARGSGSATATQTREAGAPLTDTATAD
ncbi:hypothetical protein ACFWWT_38675 [Streptomyces sp. NPDC058676]|uniref:hypothetical protein n=1 Tax=unclassified Streptomyces TaxID=2593676 RepID=UPI00364B7466